MTPDPSTSEPSTPPARQRQTTFWPLEKLRSSDDAHAKQQASAMRVLLIGAASVGLAVLAAFFAQLLTRAINFVTNLSFYGRLSVAPASPAGHSLGAAVIAVPILGGIVVGLMARFGSAAIRGHGIPEAMERVLKAESKIPARLTILKPLSAAISIGTGGPFGAEGPIIATGSALGSLFGQLGTVTAAERKTLLAAGAAAGMAATFGSPVSAVFLAIELLLFEFRPRSLVPVALASVTATVVRAALVGDHAVFAMERLESPSAAAIACYTLLGALTAVVAVGVTRLVYLVEEWFEKLPVHWMWWPALGAVAVGVVGFIEPRTLGVGYDNIERVVAGSMTLRAVALLCGLKLVSWAISLGSGTSGGTLAPLLTIGAGAGALGGALLQLVFPHARIDLRMAAMIGMASMFAGASRAALTSAIFAFETTRQSEAVMPLLTSCLVSLVISMVLMRHSIMTEKIAKRGVRVLGEYQTDPLEEASVADFASRAPATLRADSPIGDVRTFLRSQAPDGGHRGYPILDAEGLLTGHVSRREVLENHAPDEMPLGEVFAKTPVVCPADASLGDAARLLAAHGVPRLCVVDKSDPRKLFGVLTRSDLMRAYARRHEADERRSEAQLFKRSSVRA